MARTENRDDRERDSEFTDKLVHVSRVAKVVEGWPPVSGFAALVVVGDQKGRVGLRPPQRPRKCRKRKRSTDCGKRGLVRVPLREGRTLRHDWRRSSWRRSRDPAGGACSVPGSSPVARCAPRLRNPGRPGRCGQKPWFVEPLITWCGQPLMRFAIRCRPVWSPPNVRRKYPTSSRAALKAATWSNGGYRYDQENADSGTGQKRYSPDPGPDRYRSRALA